MFYELFEDIYFICKVRSGKYSKTRTSFFLRLGVPYLRRWYEKVLLNNTHGPVWYYQKIYYYLYYLPNSGELDHPSDGGGGEEGTIASPGYATDLGPCNLRVIDVTSHLGHQLIMDIELLDSKFHRELRLDPTYSRFR